MNIIYVSTDAEEAACVIEDKCNPKINSLGKVIGPRINAYDNLSINQGRLLSQELGFNPMSRIRISDERKIESAALQLSNMGYFVAIKNNSSVTHMPRKSDLLDLRVIDLGYR